MAATATTNMPIRDQVDTFVDNVKQICQSEPEEEDDIDSIRTFDKFDASKHLGSTGGMTVTKGKTKLHLLDLIDPSTGTNEEIEIGVPMKIMYDYDPTRGKLTLKSSNSDLTKFLSQVQTRALEIAIEHCPHGWKQDDMIDFGKWSFPTHGQIKGSIRVGTDDATRIFSFDPKTQEYTESDTNILKRGYTVYCVIRFRFIWFSSDSCGLSYAITTAAVVPKTTTGFDFILPGSSVTYNESNRLFTEVDSRSELDFSRNKYVNPTQGNIGYYFNVDSFQLPQGRTPWGFQVSDTNPNVGSIDLDVVDSSLPFWEKLDLRIREGIIDSYSRWFGSKPKQITVDTLKEKSIYKPTVRPSSDPSRFKPLYKLKVYTDPSNVRRCVEIFVWDSQTKTHRKGTITDIQPMCKIIPIVNISNLHFKMGGNGSVTKIGLILHAKRLLVYPNTTTAPKKPKFLRQMTQVDKIESNESGDTDQPSEDQEFF